MKAVFFDLDNTLYSADSSLFDLIDKRINTYMREVVGIDGVRVDSLRRHYWEKYGVTLRGLMREYGTDAEHYLEYVHDIDVHTRLTSDLELKKRLDSMPEQRFVFTNGSSDHARRVLNCLGVSDCFEHIYDIRISNYTPKPNPEPYIAALNHCGLNGTECIMVEDSVANLDTAARLNMGTILVGAKSAVAHVDAAVATASEAIDTIACWRAEAAACGQ